jgi:hypothetical protein
MFYLLETLNDHRITVRAVHIEISPILEIIPNVGEVVQRNICTQ